MDQGHGYAAGLEQILKASHAALKESIERFQESCRMVRPERNFPQDLIVDIRKAYKEIQDQLRKIKGIQQLLQGRYRSFYQENPRRNREIKEFEFLAKNCYQRFEYTLKEIEAKRRFREEEIRLRNYGPAGSAPWFRSSENQALLLKSLRSLDDLNFQVSNRPWPEERRHVPQKGARSLSLFLLSGEVDHMDDLEGKIRLREYDITERYGPDEFRGALTHFREVSPQEAETIVRRLIRSGISKKPKGLLFPIQSPKDLEKEVFGSTKRLLHGLAEGEVRMVTP